MSRVWGGGGGQLVFLGGSEIVRGGPQNFSGPLPWNFNYILESSAQAQSIGTLVG